MAPLDGVYGVLFSLNESPSEKEGKCYPVAHLCRYCRRRLNESPSEKEGKFWPSTPQW